MAFEGITEKLQNVFKKLTGRGKLSEKDVEAAMREIKLVLLEADVNFLVVKQFIKDVTARAIGAEVLESLTPGQQVIKIVNEELTKLMGGTAAKLELGNVSPAVLLIAGLQGSGKTTMCGKLALHLKKQYRKSPLLVACDIYRPAAIKQLQIVGEKAEVPVFEKGTNKPDKTAIEAIAYAKKNLHDVVIIDTAGRLHIDEELMQELNNIKQGVNPIETLLVVDAMTGQDALNIAKAFEETIGLTGVILTKLDGDSRGGAALSVRAVTGKPIKFAGVGEKLGDIEPFYPDRIASRILGMGDVLSLIEKAQESFDEKKAAEMVNKLRKDAFTLEDYLYQFKQIKSMGSLGDILSMLPGMGGKNMDNLQIDEKQMARVEAIILSMTPKERNNPDILNSGRRKRIAKGSGTNVQDVNRLINQYEASKKMMKQFSRGKHGKMRLPFPM